MTPPRPRGSPSGRDALEEARRRLDEAAGAIDGMRRLAAASEAADTRAAEPASQSVWRRALAAARDDLRRMATDLETESARGGALLEEVGRLREELAARPTARDLKEARAAGESNAARRAAELVAQVAGLQERVALLNAERVRLEVLRRKAEAFGAEEAASRRSLEETLRRELRAAHGALDRAAAESGIRDAKAITEIEALRKRLDHALHRLEREQTRRETAADAASAPGGGDVDTAALAGASEPSWARLLRLVKTPLHAAYGHLRWLSLGPMSAGSRAILRLSGGSLGAASDSLATIELALADSPAALETAPVLPVLESALAAWEAVFKRRAIALAREFASTLPDSPHDPEQLRLALHHVLRNAAQALARGAVLRVRLSEPKARVLRLEFRDDGPGYPLAWLERRFEFFAAPRPGHAGLGLAAVRRALRRWGGDAEASNAEYGRGACLALTFAPARPISPPWPSPSGA